MKLFVISSLPETMLSLIVLEPEADKIVFATNSTVSERLDQFGIVHELINIPKRITHMERDSCGNMVCSKLPKHNGYDLAKGLYPDRLRFWFDHQIENIYVLLNGMVAFSEIYIESSLKNYTSWAIVDHVKSLSLGAKVILVKSDQSIYDPEFRLVDSLDFDEIVVSTNRDVEYLKTITKRPVKKINYVVWEETKRPIATREDIISIRSQVGIPSDLHVTGIVYHPQDDWKLLALFREHRIRDYVLFFASYDRERFLKSIPDSIRDNALFRYDSLSMADICDSIYFPRYIPECDKVSKHINLVFYDFNNQSHSQELIDAGVI